MISPLTPEQDWQPRLQGLPTWEPPQRHTLILSPHPDDETLGAGGLIARLRSAGMPVTVVAVTDGERSYSNFPDLAAVREREQTEALQHLGVDRSSIHRLHLPDSNVAACEARLTAALLPLIDRETIVVTPWQHDFHPDHEACGRAAAAAAQPAGASLVSYFFWTWHRGTPATLEGLPLVALPLHQDELHRKKAALLCHQSQLHNPNEPPILPENLLGPAERTFEVFLPS